MQKQRLRIAVAGNPNCGKTTLFNELTGSPADGRQLARCHRRSQDRSLLL